MVKDCSWWKVCFAMFYFVGTCFEFLCLVILVGFVLFVSGCLGFTVWFDCDLFWCFDLTLVVLLGLVVVFVSWFDLNRICLCCVF